MEQKWNDVIALKNNRYNGGYKFSTYQWYLNDTPIPNETQSFIYVKDGGTLAMGQKYKALLTRADDGMSFFTCPLIPEPRYDITQYPTIVGASSHFNIRAKGATKVKIYAVTGILVSEQLLANNADNIIVAPSASGVYILLFEANGEKVDSGKIVVR
jgi:hypothetical protein